MLIIDNIKLYTKNNFHTRVDMKILMVNNNHFFKGGACRAYFDSINVLEKNGHQVAHFSTKSENNISSLWEKYFVKYYELSDSGKFSIFEKIKIVFRIWYNLEAQKKLRSLLKDFKPDVAHLHNIYHHLSPSVINELKKQEIPIVMTLHDFKIVCPNYDLFAHGDVYNRCKHGKYYQCVVDKCVKNSYLKSIVCMIEAYIHSFLKIYEKVDVFTAPSKFYMQKAREFGFPRQIEFLPNPILNLSDPKPEREKQLFEPEKFFLFYGQLNEEKGIDDLLKAYSKIFVEEKLYILGDGPKKEELERLAGKLGIRENVRFISFAKTSKEKIDELQEDATAVVSPSRCYENAPYSVLEAMGLGSTVICHNQGGAKEIVGNGDRGFVYEKNNFEDLAAVMKKAADCTDNKKEKINRGKKFIRDNYGESKFYSSLINIYNQAQREAGVKKNI